MTDVVTRATEIPAVRDAAAFAPTARNRNPHVLRLSSHQMTAAAKRATINPRFARSSEPNKCGRRALIFTSGASGSWRPGRKKAVVLNSQSKKYPAT